MQQFLWETCLFMPDLGKITTMNNSTKVWLFILSTCLFLLVIGYQFGGRLGLFIGFLMALGFNLLIFFFGENHLLKKMKCVRLKGQDAWGLNETAEKVSNLLGVTPPKIYLFSTSQVTSFCTSPRMGAGSIAFSEGLLKKLSPSEVEAVVTHQICQINQMDSFGFSASSTLANAVVGFGQQLDQFLPLPIFKHLLAPVGWLIIKPTTLATSFYETDSAAAELIDDRFRLGKVLWKIHGYAQTDPLPVPPCTSHLFITNPEPLLQKNFFLKAHPPIEVRLQKLMGYFPP